ncbi:His/Gly/Thr/Pro-type tRNA ligase C-terminal domain-containing protein, partial [Spongiibacter sp. UBA6593]
GFKIREHTIQKVPYILVVGDKEVENRTVAVRARGGEDLGSLSFDELNQVLTDGVTARSRANSES